MPVYTHKLMRLDTNNEWVFVRLLMNANYPCCASREKVVRR